MEKGGITNKSICMVFHRYVHLKNKKKSINIYTILRKYINISYECAVQVDGHL